MTTTTPTSTAKPAARAKPVRATKVGQPELAQKLSDEAKFEILNLGNGSNSIELKLSVPATGQRATVKSIGLDPVEMWLYPDGSRILEISTKCLPREAFQAAAEFRAYLARHGIALGAEQAPKTRTSLEFFSARLKNEGLAD